MTDLIVMYITDIKCQLCTCFYLLSFTLLYFLEVCALYYFFTSNTLIFKVTEQVCRSNFYKIEIFGIHNLCGLGFP